jgi:hypothetical protein
MVNLRAPVIEAQAIIFFLLDFKKTAKSVVLYTFQSNHGRVLLKRIGLLLFIRNSFNTLPMTNYLIYIDIIDRGCRVSLSIVMVF